MRYLKTNKLYCFSPPVMLATFIIEIACALYVLARYTLTPVTRLGVLILVGLATFQLAEYNVCETAWGVDSTTWARIGYVAITTLPPLGLHMAMRIAGKVHKPLLFGSYAAAVVFACIFLFVGHGMQGEACLGNYVIFHTAGWAIWPFAVYYYGLLLLTVSYAITMAQKPKVKKSVRKALYALSIGYTAFIVPTTLVNIIDPSTLAGIPSIMCGFAVIMALVLTFGVLPFYIQGLQRKKK